MQKLPIIFLAFANDKQTADGYLRNLTLERNQIRDALKQASAGRNPVCEVIVEPDASIETIFDSFQNPAYRDRIAVFHYGGHAENFKLLLESAQGKKVEAHAAGLVPFLASQKGLQLVFLNGCSTQSQADALISKGVSAVIGTTKNVPDQVAQALSQRFYAGLGAGLSLQNAWNESVLYVKSHSGSEVKGILRAHEDTHDTFPWFIRFSNSSTHVKEWNLPEAAGNPVFGLPELDQKYYLHLPPSPYIGLKRFEQQHAGIFFGRNAEVRKLIDKIQSIYPIILYYGQSGIGKSSLLEAGLIPRLESTHQFVVMRHLHEQGMVHQLIRGLYACIHFDIPDTLPEPQEVVELWREVEKVKGKPLVFIFDQFEEIYIKAGAHPDKVWAEFCRYLKPLSDALSDSKAGKIIFSFRAEYLPQIQDALSKNRIAKTDLLLAPIGRQGMVEAVSGVAGNPLTADFYHLHEGHIEADLIEKIVVDLRQDLHSPIAPMLQILLTKLWDRATKNQEGERILSLNLYNEIHKEGIALHDFIQTRFASIRALDQDSSRAFYKEKVESSGLVLDLLEQFVTKRNTTDSLAITEVINRYPHRSKVMAKLIVHLVDARVLGEFVVNGEQCLSLAHDTLAPIVRELYDISDRPGQRARGILEGKIHSGIADSHLDAEDLAQVEEGLDGMRTLTQDETALIERSTLERDKALKRQKLVRRVGIGAVVLILAFGLAATLFWRDATRRAFEAETNRIAALSFGAFEHDNSAGINLAIEAVNRHLNKETGFALSVVTEKAGPLYYASLDGHRQAVFAVSYAPDGNAVLTGSQDSTAILWDLNGHAQMKFRGHKAPVSGVAFSPDSKKILTSSWDGTAKLWNLSGEVIHSYEPQAGPLTAATFSPDGKFIATTHGDGNALMWTIEGTIVQKFIGHTKPTTTVVFSPDGRYLFTTSQDMTGRLWTLDGSLVQEFIGHSGEVYSAAFSPDGQYVVTGSWDQSAILWNLKGEKLMAYINQDDDQGVMDRGVMSVAFSPDGRYILDGSYDFRVRLWSLEGEVVSTYLGHEKAVIGVAFSPDGRNILTGGEDQTAKLWRLQDKRMQTYNPAHASVLNVTYSPDGKHMLIGSADHTVLILDQDGNLVRKLEAHTQPVHTVTYSPDGKFILTGSKDSTLMLWTAEGDMVRRYTGHKGGINSAVFTPAGDRILSGSDDQTAILWKIDGQIERVFSSHSLAVLAVAVSPDGQQIMTGSADLSAILWTIDGNILQSYDAISLVHSVAFSPDGKFVYTGSSDQRVGKWRKDGKQVLRFRGHAGPVTAIAVDDSGEYLLTGSSDKTVKLWRTDGLEIQTFGRFASGVSSVAFAPDGIFVLSGSYDHTIKQGMRWNHFHDERILAPLNDDQREHFGVR